MGIAEPTTGEVVAGLDKTGHYTDKATIKARRMIALAERQTERARICRLLADGWARFDSEVDRPLSLDGFFGLIADEWPMTDAALLARLEEATR